VPKSIFDNQYFNFLKNFVAVALNLLPLALLILGKITNFAALFAI